MSFGEPLRYLETTDSTNREALEWPEASHGAVVIANTQTAGRGRLGRIWSSPPDRGLYLSVVLRPEKSVPLPQISLVAALACARAVERESGLLIQTKWPNDLLWRGQKIGGILCEANAERAVVGIGLNCNHDTADLPERPLYPASSLLLATGQTHEVARYSQAILRALETDFGRLKAADWPQLRAEFSSRCATLGEVVPIQQGGESFYALAESVDEDGALLVKTASGARKIVAGEIIGNGRA